MFESSVLVFQLPQSSCIAAVHPLVLGPPLLERPRMNSNPPCHLVDRNGSRLDLLDASDDLLLAVPRLARHSLLLLYRTAVPALSVEQFSGSRPARRRCFLRDGRRPAAGGTAGEDAGATSPAR